MKITTRSIVSAGVAAAIMLVGGAGAAFAGEVTGGGDPVTIHAKSLCAFSGLEDWTGPEPQPEGALMVSPGTVQNWGHVKRAFGIPGGANSVQTPDRKSVV